MTARPAAGLITAALPLITALLAACTGSNSGQAPSPSAPAGGTPLSGTIAIKEAAYLTAYGGGEATFPSDQPGLAVGDFNDDGIDDFVVGTRFADPPAGDDAGAAYVVFGAGGLSGRRDFAEGEQDFTVFGPGSGAGLGFSASAGDLNDDGVDDLIIGAPFATESGADKGGAAYAFFGPIGPGEVGLDSSSADVTLSGAAGSYFGDSLATGDVNGDGLADLVVGATFASEPGGPAGGAVYVFLGRTDWPVSLDAAGVGAEVVIYGAEQFDELGDFVAVGDLNADGIDDIAATAEAADGPGNDRETAGEVYVYFGHAGFAGARYAVGQDPDISVYGAAANDTLGFALAVTGGTLAISAHLATPPGGQGAEGAVYLVRGGPELGTATPGMEIDLADPPPGLVTVAGVDPGGLLATSIGFLPEAARIVLGGSLVDSAGPDGGVVYILPADLSGTVPVDGPGTLLFAGSESERLGSNVASGDFNADGRTDLAVVAELASGPDESRPEAGRVYLVTP